VKSAFAIYILICVGADWILKLGRIDQAVRDAILWLVTLVFFGIKLWPERLKVVLPPNGVEAEVISQARLAFVPIVICMLFALFYLFALRLLKLSFSATLVRLQLVLFVLGGLIFWSPQELIGFMSMSRRYIDYVELFQMWQRLQLAGIVFLLISLLVFVGLVWRSTRMRSK
jgi:hypothetical protein